MKAEKLTTAERLYLLLCGLVYIMWTISFIHTSYAPDETMRYDIPKFIYENGMLPFGDEAAIRNPVWGTSYGFLLTLPTVLSAIFMKLMSFVSTAPAMLVVAARMVSVLSMLGTGYFAIRITKKIFRTPVRWVFIVLITMTPQFVFLSSYVNNDAFGLFTAMLIIYAWICGLETKWDLKSCLLLAAGGGLCLVGYTWYWTFVLCSLFVYCASYFKYRKDGFTTARFFKYGLLIIGVALLFCGWIYLRAIIIYEGDILGTAHSNAVSELYAAEGFSASEVAARALAKNGVGLWEMLYHRQWLIATVKSFFYAFGYMAVWAPDWIYEFYIALIRIGILGVGAQLISGRYGWQQQVKRSSSLTGQKFYEWFMLMMFMALSGGITFLFSIWRSWTGDYQSQGRYILAIAPILFLLIAYAIETIVGLAEKFFKKDLILVKKVVTGCMILVIFMTMLYGFRACVSNFGMINF